MNSGMTREWLEQRVIELQRERDKALELLREMVVAYERNQTDEEFVLELADVKDKAKALLAQ